MLYPDLSLGGGRKKFLRVLGNLDTSLLLPHEYRFPPPPRPPSLLPSLPTPRKFVNSIIHQKPRVGNARDVFFFSLFVEKNSQDLEKKKVVTRVPNPRKKSKNQNQKKKKKSWHASFQGRSLAKVKIRIRDFLFFFPFFFSFFLWPIFLVTY